MKMVRFPLFGRNSVYIDPHKKRSIDLIKLNVRFFQRLPRRNLRQRRVGLFHVPARQQPPAQPVMIDHQYPQVARMEDQRSTRDMPGPVLTRRKRLRSMMKQQLHQVFTLGRDSVVAGVEGSHGLQGFFPFDRQREL